jgi:hypothetical protein
MVAMSSEEGRRILFQADVGDSAELVPGTLPAYRPPQRISWWRRACWRLRRSPHRLLCNAMTGHYLCCRYRRKQQPLAVRSYSAGEFMDRLDDGEEDR